MKGAYTPTIHRVLLAQLLMGPPSQGGVSGQQHPGQVP